MSVGQRLQHARQELRLSLKDVSQATKIQPWVLEALEADRIPTTMSPVYVKGFLATYAKHLRLDPHPLIAELFPAPAPAVSQESVSVPAPATPSWLRRTLPDWQVSVQAFPWRGVPVAVGVAGLVVLIRLNPAQRLASGIAHRSASVSLATTQSQPRLETAVQLEPTRTLELGIAAQRPTWVSVHADGKLIAQQHLAAGAHETWHARRTFEVIVGAPARVEMTLNGQSISPLAMAHHGRLAITHTGITPLERSGASPSVAANSAR